MCGVKKLFHGFDEIGKQLGISSDDDLWLEVNCYENSSQQKKVLSSVKHDPKALLASGRLQKLAGPSSHIVHRGL